MKGERNDEQKEDEARRHFLERSFEGWRRRRMKIGKSHKS